MAHVGSVLTGLVGGLIGTIVVTALGDGSPPPTAASWSRYVGPGPPTEYVMQGMAPHLLYGVVAVGVFAVGATALGLGVVTLTGGLLWGIIWAVVPFVIGAVFRMRLVLGTEAGGGTVVMFGAVHPVYGIVPGAWVGLGVP